MWRHAIGLYLLLLLASDIESTNSQSVDNFGDCRTPSNIEGSCKYLPDCRILYSILERGNVTSDERRFLQSSQCGFRDKQILVCCPNEVVVSSRTAVDLNLLPEPPNCPQNLVIVTRIVGGHDTQIDEYPWLARIEYTKPDNTREFHCGGNLINNQYVLTAAHCVSGNLPTGWVASGVRLGEWDTRTTIDCVRTEKGDEVCADPHLDISIEKIIPHHLYMPESKNQHNDIALIRLSKPVWTTQFVMPICLPQDNMLREARFESRVLSTAGWGRTESADNSFLKQYANLNVWNLDECRQKYAVHNISIGDGQICAGGKAGVDSCRGDSGGSLAYVHMTDRPNYILAGIGSFGTKNCGMEGWPGIYTRVGKYLDWIRANVEA